MKTLIVLIIFTDAKKTNYYLETNPYFGVIAWLQQMATFTWKSISDLYYKENMYIATACYHIVQIIEFELKYLYL